MAREARRKTPPRPAPSPTARVLNPEEEEEGEVCEDEGEEVVE